VRAATPIEIALAAFGILLASSDPAVAQVNGATRPYRALFGGSTSNPDVHHSFDVTTSVWAGYDDNSVPGVADDTIVSPLLQTGGYLGLSAGVAYGWRSRRVQVGANFGSSTRYYEDISRFYGTTHTASIGMAAQVGERTRLFANQSVSRAPSYLYSLVPNLDESIPGTIVGGGSVPLGDLPVYVYDTTASAEYSVTRRGSLEGLASYRFSDFEETGVATTQALRSYAVGGRFRQGLTRYASLRLGYVYRQGHYNFARGNAFVGVHDIDVGVDYARALSLTRRTTLDFGTGSTIVTIPVIDAAVDPSAITELQFRVVGNVGLTREMGRTWKLRGSYYRGVGFAEAFAQPVFSDSVNASLNGFLSRRVDLSVNGGFSRGDVGLGRTPNGQEALNSSFKTWTFSARTRYALGAMWALYGEYLYYSQDLGSSFIVPTGVPSVVDRQTIQVGLTLWVPLLRR
jgi:hypothetical protein